MTPDNHFGKRFAPEYWRTCFLFHAVLCKFTHAEIIFYEHDKYAELIFNIQIQKITV